MERYEHLEKALCKELEKLDKKYTTEVEMTEQDAERADKLYHALKSAATYHAMKEEEEWEGEEGEDGYSGEGRSNRRGGRSSRGGSYRGGGGSYAQRRSPYTGRFMSREMGGGGYSGGYPMEFIDLYWDRRY